MSNYTAQTFADAALRSGLVRSKSDLRRRLAQGATGEFRKLGSQSGTDDVIRSLVGPPRSYYRGPESIYSPIYV